MRSAAFIVFSALAATAISGCAVVQTEFGEGVAIYATPSPVEAAPRGEDAAGAAPARQVLMICTGFKTMRLNCWRPDDDAAVAPAVAATRPDRRVLDDVPALGAVLLPAGRAAARVPEPRRGAPDGPGGDRYEPRVPRPPALVKPARTLAPGEARRSPTSQTFLAGVY